MRRKKKYLLLAFCLLLGFSVLGIQASAKDSKPEIRYIKVTKKMYVREMRSAIP